uniref:Uncharacterized protein n=1 Tax=Clostridium perfringens TaxID=1502 RepID=K9MFP5_CLOPF|nr:hypothetical protein [Clostridium perfringens]AFV15102.1 hypothetical protein pCpb2-CP1_14 [Clostridium perfringens]
MSENLLCEIEKLDLEFSSLSNRKLNKKDLEYRKYLISKLQRLSKEYLRSCGIRNKYKLEKILVLLGLLNIYLIILSLINLIKAYFTVIGCV